MSNIGLFFIVIGLVWAGFKLLDIKDELQERDADIANIIGQLSAVRQWQKEMGKTLQANGRKPQEVPVKKAGVVSPKTPQLVDYEEAEAVRKLQHDPKIKPAK